MQPASKKQRVGDEGSGIGAGPQARQQRVRKKKQPPTPEIQARSAIHQAAKENDLATALSVFDRAKANEVKLGRDLYISLLYLCSGGEAWEAQLLRQGAAAPETAADGAAEPHANGRSEATAAAGDTQQQQQQEQQQQAGDEEPAEAAAGPSHQPPQQLEAAEVRARAQQLFDEMRGSGDRLAPSEMCYTALARLAAGGGDADRAFALVQEMLEAGIAPKLRSFNPALIAYAEAGACDKAFEVNAAISAQQLDLGEPEFCRLLQAATADVSWQRGEAVLRRMGSELTVLQTDTLDRVAALFASPAAAAAFAAEEACGRGNGSSGGDGTRWEVGPTTVSAEGLCASCGGQLVALDLTGEELVRFAEGIAAIAERQERHPNDFQQFKAWLEQHGPFGAVVDGANVALFGKNFESGGFSFGQIRVVVNHLASWHPDLKPLLLLNVGRTKAPQARTPEAQALMKELTEKGSFYVTPAGSNDDWYWIYAAVKAGERGLLVSNDEMRDHIFQLLAPKYFLKWKQRHQLKYRFTTGGLQLDYPAPFTTCTQQLACGSWLFPGADSSWLCARRVPSSGPAAGAAEVRAGEAAAE